MVLIKHTTDIEEPKWVKMQSITQENDLEAFLSTAELAGTEFTAGLSVVLNLLHSAALTASCG